MALNYSSSFFATDDVTLDISSTVSSANPTFEEVSSPTGFGRDLRWSGSDVFFDPVDFLPMDPFGMNMASSIGDVSDYWMECFDPADMLPLDPFGMSLETVIESLIEDFEAIYGYSDGNDNQVERIGYYSDMPYHSSSDDFVDMEATLSAAIAGWVEDFQAISIEYPVVEDHSLDTTLFEDYLDLDYMLPSDLFEMELGFTLTATIASLIGDMTGDMTDISNSKSGSIVSDNFNCEIEEAASELVMNVEPFFDSSGSELACSKRAYGDDLLHDGLFFALGYLGVQDLLSVEMVCKSLRTAVVDDPLLWKCIQINSTLSLKITDDALLHLTRRAQGNLHCLSLVTCTKISDGGLRCVLEDNPKLIKLCVPECVKLSIGGMINNLRVFKVNAIPGIKQLKLGRLFSVSHEHFQELKLLLGIDQSQQQMAYKPRFYHIARLFLECDDDRTLDIEMCPVCNNYKLVYDCSLESCRGKGPETCRACLLCIRRCAQCGRCIRDDMYDETFSFEYLCSGCWENRTIW